LVQTVHCVTESTICRIVGNSIRRYQENTPTEEGGDTVNTRTKEVKPISFPPHTNLRLQHKMVSVSALLHYTDTRVNVSTAPLHRQWSQCQHCSTTPTLESVSALLHYKDTRVAMTNVIAGGSLRKVQSWEFPPAATNWKEHSLLLGMRDIRKGN